jgi:hypothetical protein
MLLANNLDASRSSAGRQRTATAPFGGDHCEGAGECGQTRSIKRSSRRAVAQTKAVVIDVSGSCCNRLSTIKTGTAEKLEF